MLTSILVHPLFFSHAVKQKKRKRRRLAVLLKRPKVNIVCHNMQHETSMMQSSKNSNWKCSEFTSGQIRPSPHSDSTQDIRGHWDWAREEVVGAKAIGAFSTEECDLSTIKDVTHQRRRRSASHTDPSVSARPDATGMIRRRRRRRLFGVRQSR